MTRQQRGTQALLLALLCIHQPTHLLPIQSAKMLNATLDGGYCMANDCRTVQFDNIDETMRG